MSQDMCWIAAGDAWIPNHFFLEDQKTLFWISKRLLTKSLPSPPRQESQIFSKLHELCEDNGNGPGIPAKCKECNPCHPWRLAILFYFWRRASSGDIISLSSMGGDIAYERHTRFFHTRHDHFNSHRTAGDEATRSSLRRTGILRGNLLQMWAKVVHK